MFTNTEILLLVHDLNTKEKWELFVQTASFLKNAEAPVIALLDKTCNPRYYKNIKSECDPRDILKENDCCEIREDQPTGEWEKVRYAFDQSKKDYIAICHQDDWWKAGKLRLQLRAIKDSDSPICMTAYDSVTLRTIRNQLSISEYKIPIVHPIYGCISVMPSMWLLSRKKIKKWVIPFQAVTAVDIATCMELCQWVKRVPVLTTSTLFYNAHPQNTTNLTAKKPDWEDALNRCQRYTQDMLSPKFHYISQGRDYADAMEIFAQSLITDPKTKIAFQKWCLDHQPISPQDEYDESPEEKAQWVHDHCQKKKAEVE